MIEIDCWNKKIKKSKRRQRKGDMRMSKKCNDEDEKSEMMRKLEVKRSRKPNEDSKKVGWQDRKMKRLNERIEKSEIIKVNW